jgi:hypothetical protein
VGCGVPGGLANRNLCYISSERYRDSVQAHTPKKRGVDILNENFPSPKRAKAQKFA